MILIPLGIILGLCLISALIVFIDPPVAEAKGKRDIKSAFAKVEKFVESKGQDDIHINEVDTFFDQLGLRKFQEDDGLAEYSLNKDVIKKPLRLLVSVDFDAKSGEVTVIEVETKGLEPPGALVWNKEHQDQ
ncbi:MAG: hypothetical protein KDC26_07680 [Armatimonadetes bacterium]|nr:hypothetical protein [Armatimonadota bacterium]